MNCTVVLLFFEKTRFYLLRSKSKINNAFEDFVVELKKNLGAC